MAGSSERGGAITWTVSRDGRPSGRSWSSGAATTSRDRADAGHGLAAFADAQEARGPLSEPVFDQGDTKVTW